MAGHTPDLCIGAEAAAPRQETFLHTRAGKRPLHERMSCGIVHGVDPDANKRLVEQFYDEVWAHGNVEFAAEVFADDYVRHDLRPTQGAPGVPDRHRSRTRSEEHFQTCWGGSIFSSRTAISSLRGGPPRALMTARGLELRRRGGEPSFRA
jgi:hypothetical protein